jgi:hypothetical protein
MELEEVRKRLDAALSIFLENDTILFEKDLGEPVLSHRLGFYLQTLFPNHFVDCEYDKYGLGDKIQRYSDKDMRPDIIIHGRFPDPSEGNLVVIEMKKVEYPDYDAEAKLMEFTDTQGSYRYEYGFFVGFRFQNDRRTPIKRLYLKGLPKL